MLSGHLCRCTSYVGIVRAVMNFVSRCNMRTQGASVNTTDSSTWRSGIDQ